MAKEWAEDPDKRAALLPLAGEFVDASVAAGTARERLERRRATRLRSIVVVLTVLVVAVCLLAGYAFKQRQQATAARDVAITAQQDANSREVANEAAQLRPSTRRWPPSSASPPRHRAHPAGDGSPA